MLMIREDKYQRLIIDNGKIYIYMNFLALLIIKYVVAVVPMSTPAQLRARRIDDVECGLFSNHAPLGQTTLRVG